MNAIDLCPQLGRLPQEEALLLEHARTCAVCQAQVRQLKPACTDPALGVLASLGLGEAERFPALGVHLAGCLACCLEQLGFASCTV